MERILESWFSDPGHTGTPARRVLHIWQPYMGSRGQKRDFKIDFSIAPWWLYHLRKKVVVVEKGQIVIIWYRAFLLDNLLNFLKLHIKIILLSKPNPMVEFACLCSWPFRNDILQKMAKVNLKNQRKRLIHLHFVKSISPRFLTRFHKTWYENYTSVQAISNGVICVWVLKTV